MPYGWMPIGEGGRLCVFILCETSVARFRAGRLEARFPPSGLAACGPVAMWQPTDRPPWRTNIYHLGQRAASSILTTVCRRGWAPAHEDRFGRECAPAARRVVGFLPPPPFWVSNSSMSSRTVCAIGVRRGATIVNACGSKNGLHIPGNLCRGRLCFWALSSCGLFWPDEALSVLSRLRPWANHNPSAPSTPSSLGKEMTQLPRVKRDGDL